MRPPEIPFTCEVTGRQFNWDFRYPGPDNVLYTPDDIVRTDGNLYLPYGEEVLLKITSGRRAPQLLPAEPAAEARRDPRHGPEDVVPHHRRRQLRHRLRPNCAAGAITR